MVCLHATTGVTQSYAWRSNNEFSRRTRRLVFYFYFFAYLPVVTSNQENNRPRVVIRSIVVYTSHGIPMMNRPIYSYNKTAGYLKILFFSKIRRTFIIYLNFRFSKKIKFNTWSNTVIFAKTSLFILLFIICLLFIFC